MLFTFHFIKFETGGEKKKMSLFFLSLIQLRNRTALVARGIICANAIHSTLAIDLQGMQTDIVLIV